MKNNTLFYEEVYSYRTIDNYAESSPAGNFYIALC